MKDGEPRGGESFQRSSAGGPQVTFFQSKFYPTPPVLWRGDGPSGIMGWTSCCLISVFFGMGGKARGSTSPSSSARGDRSFFVRVGLVAEALVWFSRFLLEKHFPGRAFPEKGAAPVISCSGGSDLSFLRKSPVGAFSFVPFCCSHPGLEMKRRGALLHAVGAIWDCVGEMVTCICCVLFWCGVWGM